MARRRLFSDEHWAGLFALPADERDVVRHCTLTPDDLALIGVKRSAHNRLGYALLLCALRYPGRALDVGEVPPVRMVAYIARQLGVDPATLAAYPGRPQTRREQLSELGAEGPSVRNRTVASCTQYHPARSGGLTISVAVGGCQEGPRGRARDHFCP
jgi:TnpA family transposase